MGDDLIQKLTGESYSALRAFAGDEGARRIAACLRVCEGIPTEWMDKSDEGAIDFIVTSANNEVSNLKRQRDGLLYALKKISEMNPSNTYGAVSCSDQMAGIALRAIVRHGSTKSSDNHAPLESMRALHGANPISPERAAAISAAKGGAQ